MKNIIKTIAVILAFIFCLPALSAYAAKPMNTAAKTYTAKDIVDRSELWVANERTFTAAVKYANPFDDATLDMVLTNTTNGTVLNIPGFWDGGNTWRVRFALTSLGLWTYKTVCSNPKDTGLDNQTGAVLATPYTGNLDIYKHGFVTATAGTRYFTYNDKTPFFYLGDTHWGMASEELDSAGAHAGNLNITSHFKYIVDTRVKQGFTVYQSEPIGATYNLSNGISEDDIAGFDYLDRQFDYIAKAGLVHANACLMFPADMTNAAFSNKDYMEKLTRYWVARYSVYPVLWTLGQEVDKDFYGVFNVATNPYITMCENIYKYDAYKHPISAHQEGTGSTSASNSAFKGVPGHTWFAAQWSPSLTSQFDFTAPKDYWNNGDGKVAVNYEGRYDYLWTKHFGSRVQGWTSYLNGMYGYGYGCADIWLYNSTYDMTTTSNDGIDIITPADKATFWSQSLEFETPYQLGYMRDFLNSVFWWNLTPRFDDSTWSSPDVFYNLTSKILTVLKGNGSLLEKLLSLIQIGDGTPYYSLATNGNYMYVADFYNQTTYTGVIKNMDKASRYTVQWFNPRTGKYEGAEKVIKPNIFGNYRVGGKPDSNDWVLLMVKQK